MKGRLFLLMLLMLFPSLLWALESSEIRNDGDGVVAAKQYDDPKEAVARVPAFVTDLRTDKLVYYPCENCHTKGLIAPNEKVRELTDMHAEIQLQHGGGRFWCTTCHDLTDRNYLVSLKKQRISLNDPYLLCGQCHSARQKDYFMGAHGRRKANWKGEKRLTNCTECHNPHAPKTPPRIPRTKPVARMGLSIVPTEDLGGEKVWEKYEEAKTSHSESKKP